MFEEFNEITKATQKQKIALQAMNTVGIIEWVDYADNGDLIVGWCDGDYGLTIKFRISRKGESSLASGIFKKRY